MTDGITVWAAATNQKTSNYLECGRIESATCRQHTFQFFQTKSFVRCRKRLAPSWGSCHPLSPKPSVGRNLLCFCFLTNEQQQSGSWWLMTNISQEMFSHRNVVFSQLSSSRTQKQTSSRAPASKTGSRSTLVPPHKTA